MSGLFITVEGPDGSGKSMLVKALSKRMAGVLNVPLVTTREPGGSPLAEILRDLILNPAYDAIDSRTEALLLAAGRRQHVVEKIKPALNRGEVVLSDRYVDSSITYQGAGREIGIKEVAAINQFAIEDTLPDLTLYLDVDAQVGLNRIGHESSNREKDRLELEEISFHNRVRDAYHELLEENPDRFRMIDASKTPEEVLDASWEILEKYLAENHFLK